MHPGTKEAAFKSTCHYILSSTILISVYKRFFIEDDNPSNSGIVRIQQDGFFGFAVACFILFYWLSIILWRLVFCAPTVVHRQGIIYETMWMCNTTLFLPSSLILAQNGGREKYQALILGHLIAVSIDQVLWYIDLMGCFIYWLVMKIQRGRQVSSRKPCDIFFPIGVAAYLSWPETNWKTRITCTHHLWTLPLFLHLLFRSSPHSQPVPIPPTLFPLFLRAYICSIGVVAVNVIFTRWLTPAYLTLPKNYRKPIHGNKADDDSHRYLNVNLAHDVWKDVKKFPFLRITEDNPPVHTYLIRLISRWVLLNGLVSFGVLYPYTFYLYTRTHTV